MCAKPLDWGASVTEVLTLGPWNPKRSHFAILKLCNASWWRSLASNWLMTEWAAYPLPKSKGMKRHATGRSGCPIDELFIWRTLAAQPSIASTWLKLAQKRCDAGPGVAGHISRGPLSFGDPVGCNLCPNGLHKWHANGSRTTRGSRRSATLHA